MKTDDFSNEKLEKTEQPVITDVSENVNERPAEEAANAEGAKIDDTNSVVEEDIQEENSETIEDKEERAGESDEGTISKPRKLRNIIITSTVCAVALTAGIGLGVFFGKSLFATVSKKEPQDWLKYEDDTDRLMKRYEKCQGDYDKEFTPTELANISIKLFEESENHYSILEGIATATAGVKQTISTTNIRNGDDYFWESISASSFVKKAVRFYQDIKEDHVVEYSGTVIEGTKGTKAQWDKSTELHTDNFDFAEKWGKTLDVANVYTISSKTVLKEEPLIRDEDGNMVINLTMDPITANRRYCRQMISMSDLTADPEFYNLNIIMTLDDDLKIVEKTVFEKYAVTVKNPLPMTATSDTEMHEKFYYDEYLAIPDLNTHCVYGGN